MAKPRRALSGNRGSIPYRGRNLPLLQSVQIGSRGHLASGYWRLPQQVKRSERERASSIMFSAEAENGWRCTSVLPIRLGGLVFHSLSRGQLCLYQLRHRLILCRELPLSVVCQVNWLQT